MRFRVFSEPSTKTIHEKMEKLGVEMRAEINSIMLN